MNNNPCFPERHASVPPDGSLIRYPVTDTVLLAGQPEPDDWAHLVAQGFRHVINIRSDPERAAVQARNAEAAGLHYTYLPLPAYELEAEHLAHFNAALADAGDEKVVIHCRTASRVALLWMLRRMISEGWSQDGAEQELRAAGYDDDAMETFQFCSEDFFERTGALTR